MGELDREPAIVERPQDGLDVGQGRGAARAAFLEHTPSPRVAQHHPARRQRLLTKRRLPVLARVRSLDLADDHVDEPIQEIVLATDVSVQGHRVDPELLAELPHAQGLVAASIGEVHGCPEHAVAGQGRPALLGRARLGCHVDIHLDSVGRSSDLSAGDLDESTV
jgi:hypothetical protein